MHSNCIRPASAFTRSKCACISFSQQQAETELFPRCKRSSIGPSAPPRSKINSNLNHFEGKGNRVFPLNGEDKIIGAMGNHCPTRKGAEYLWSRLRGNERTWACITNNEHQAATRRKLTGVSSGQAARTKRRT